MVRVTPDKIRNKVLDDLGMARIKPESKKHRRLKHIPRRTIPDRNKTPLMRYLELVHGEPIEKLLLSGSLSQVAKHLDNEVDTSTLSKWIKRLKLRYSEDNLPNCLGCGSHGPACDVGVCYILIDLERYDLLPIKKEEMLE